MKFSLDDFQKLFEVAKILYDKQKYTYIDEFALTTFLDTIKVSQERKNDCLSMYRAISELSNEKVDFLGVMEQYTLVKIPLDLYDLVERNGGIEEFCSKLMKFESSDDQTSYLDGSISQITSVGEQDSNFVEYNLSNVITDEFKERILEGKQIDYVPFRQEHYYFARHLQGVVRGVNGLGANSGVGKSSAMISIYLLSILENSNDKICLFCNEQVKETFIHLITFAYITNVFVYLDENTVPQILKRDEFSAGFYTKEQMDYFFKAMDSWNERYKNRILHIYFENMKPETLRREVKKKYRQGYKHFIYDTFKSDEEEYKQVIELSKVMDNLTKRYNITFTITLQLSGETIGTKYLTSRNLARAKAIKEICENLVLFRKLDKEELSNLIVKTFDKETGTVKQVPLNLEKENYYAFFIDKNRNGKDNFVVMYEIDLDILAYSEVGIITNMPRDYIRK